MQNHESKIISFQEIKAEYFKDSPVPWLSKVFRISKEIGSIGIQRRTGERDEVCLLLDARIGHWTELRISCDSDHIDSNGSAEDFSVILCQENQKDIISICSYDDLIESCKKILDKN